MKTTERFDNAVRKLYKAFHEGTLNAFDCTACAVGNIVGHGNWYGWRFNNILDYEDDYLKIKDKGFSYPDNASYNTDELKNIEKVFLLQWENAKQADGRNKETQFKGLCAVIEYLCELDGIPNPMDYSKFFETVEGKPKYELV